MAGGPWALNPRGFGLGLYGSVEGSWGLIGYLGPELPVQGLNSGQSIYYMKP